MRNFGNKTNERWEENCRGVGQRKSRNRRFPAEREVWTPEPTWAGRDAGTRDGDCERTDHDEPLRNVSGSCITISDP